MNPFRKKYPIFVRFDENPSLKPRPYLLLAIGWGALQFVSVLVLIGALTLLGGPIIDWATAVIGRALQ